MVSSGLCPLMASQMHPMQSARCACALVHAFVGMRGVLCAGAHMPVVCLLCICRPCTGGSAVCLGVCAGASVLCAFVSALGVHVAKETNCGTGAAVAECACAGSVSHSHHPVAQLNNQQPPRTHPISHNHNGPHRPLRPAAGPLHPPHPPCHQLRLC